MLESAHHWKFCISKNLREMYHLFLLFALAPIQLPTIMSLPIIDYVPITFYSMPCVRPELFVTEWHLYTTTWNLRLPQSLLSTIVLFWIHQWLKPFVRSEPSWANGSRGKKSFRTTAEVALLDISQFNQETLKMCSSRGTILSAQSKLFFLKCGDLMPQILPH